MAEMTFNSDHSVPQFYVQPVNMLGATTLIAVYEAAGTFVRQRKRVERLLRKEARPLIAKIRRDSVEVWLRMRDWRR
jgi:hypothetical protein